MLSVSRGSQSTPSKGEGPPDDYLDDMAEGLLLFFNRFQWFEVKSEIEKTCGIKTEHLWSVDEIGQAWEIASSKEDPTRQQWACVITFEMMERFSFDEEAGDPSDSPADRSTKSHAKPMIQSRSDEKDEQEFGFHAVKRKQAADLSESTKALDGGFVSSSVIGVKIPLSEKFGREATSEQTGTVTSDYKLIDECPSGKEIRNKKAYVMSYDKSTKNAEWVYEVLNHETLVKNYVACCHFAKSLNIQGYDRGHLAAAANHRWCQEAYNDTFYRANMSPQDSKLNRGLWKALEYTCRDKINEIKIRNVHVYTGPILDSKSATQRSKVSTKVVPDYFYKVIIEENHDGTVSEPICYVISNDKSKIIDDIRSRKETNVPMHDFLRRYKTSVKDLENISGLSFCMWAVQIHRDEIRRVTWTGEDGRGESRSATVEVRISIPEKSALNVADDELAEYSQSLRLK
ncbi:nuclease EXOG, mitochondrial-like [Danio aesculapii]|uniref:nuclease EXOG, mitochondrial-like n=1 Tax=Danio aesculapii TaxID=1142201 RepID=UPI0024C0CCF0|nr:nuclease EXOG, mitochondrial-like [Danio aesculapii]